jgi:hypothetical protein
MQHQQQTFMQRLKECNIYIRTYTPHFPLPGKVLVNATQLATTSSFRTMEQSDLGAFAPDYYGVVPSRVQEMTAEQPPHAGELPEA